MGKGCAARANVLRKLLGHHRHRNAQKQELKVQHGARGSLPPKAEGKYNARHARGITFFRRARQWYDPPFLPPPPVRVARLISSAPPSPLDGRSEVHLTERGHLAKYKRRARRLGPSERGGKRFPHSVDGPRSTFESPKSSQVTAQRMSARHTTTTASGSLHSTPLHSALSVCLPLSR